MPTVYYNQTPLCEQALVEWCERSQVAICAVRPPSLTRAGSSHILQKDTPDGDDYTIEGAWASIPKAGHK